MLSQRALLFNSVGIRAGSWLLYLVCFLDPRRLVVAVKDTKTQLCQLSHMRNENKFGLVSDLSTGFWQVSCYLV